MERFETKSVAALLFVQVLVWGGHLSGRASAQVISGEIRDLLGRALTTPVAAELSEDPELLTPDPVANRRAYIRKFGIRAQPRGRTAPLPDDQTHLEIEFDRAGRETRALFKVELRPGDFDPTQNKIDITLSYEGRLTPVILEGLFIADQMLIVSMPKAEPRLCCGPSRVAWRWTTPTAPALATILRRGDRVQVVGSSAEVKIGRDVLAIIEPGEFVQVRETQGSWVGIETRQNGAELRGWIRRESVVRAHTPRRNDPLTSATVSRN